MQLKQIISHLNSHGVAVELRGEDSVNISQVSGLDIAKNDEISFLTDKKYLPYLENSSAAAVLLNPRMAGQYPVTQLIVENPYYAYALVAQYL
ncbi:MAG: LpxD N-terminal domain-containing protein, partial [Thiomicrorhabdus sp.]|nr:LpxD N-terminal domain-containing protein [Thiomicrorhabdus sp.]